MYDLVFALLAFILAICILVSFHELGHFWTARCFGVKVLRFSVGFGKPLLRWTDKKRTEYVLAAIPLGGYVKLLDEREGPVLDEEKPYAFTQQSVWKRFLIVIAGPVFNFIFAVFAYWLMFMMGVTGWIPIIGHIEPNSIAHQAGMVVQEEIIRVDNQATDSWSQVSRQLIKKVGSQQSLLINTKQKDESENQYYLDLSQWQLKGDEPDPLKSLGIRFYHPPIPPVIDKVIGGEPADKAGLKPGDRLVEINGQPIRQWQDFIDVVTNSPHQPLEILLKRDGKKLVINLTPKVKESNTGETVGFVGVTVKPIPMPDQLLRQVKLGPLDAGWAAVKKTYEYSVLTLQIIGKMIVGQLGLQSVSGPLTIAKGAGASAHYGLQYYIGFLGLISVSLGVLNLLPIPILDGGHLLYLVTEMFTGRPVSLRVQAVGFQIGMLFLILLMSVAFYNDIVRMF